MGLVFKLNLCNRLWKRMYVVKLLSCVMSGRWYCPTWGRWYENTSDNCLTVDEEATKLTSRSCRNHVDHVCELHRTDTGNHTWITHGSHMDHTTTWKSRKVFYLFGQWNRLKWRCNEGYQELHWKSNSCFPEDE